MDHAAVGGRGGPVDGTSARDSAVPKSVERAAVVGGDVTIVTPVPEGWLPQIWLWLCEDPEAHFDDYGPQTFEEFVAMREALRAQERLYGVLVRGVPRGFVQYVPISPMLGQMHVCFSRTVHGRGVAAEALRQIRALLIGEGVAKVTLSFFSDNTRVRRLCLKFGAVEEGLLRNHTRTRGRLRDLVVMAIFRAPDERT